MPKQKREKSGEGVRLLRAYKDREGLTASALAARLGYRSIDSYFRICRYDYSPSPEVCASIAKVIGRSRAWVMDHWASEVEARRDQQMREAV